MAIDKKPSYFFIMSFIPDLASQYTLHSINFKQRELI